ncbi:TonB C-terminal domain-containing protein [Peristeroidobacter soli]|uniref:TonB C-terminal domain-containing protein n=1 Tax=Peristeroidobacter soli TaxID=2497877 RepID=UPI00101D1F2F|nr:TonB C-terminal domain-containing protein [Peristeroidobacter soli]
MNKHRWQRYVPLAAGTVIVLVVGVLLIKFVMNLMAQKPEGPQRQVAQVVKIVRPPEDQPPPPPPPPEEKIEEPLEQQEPDQAPEEAAPAESLGVDAEGSAGGDGFGLAARKGGRDLVGTGTAPFRWYTDLVAKSLEGCFSEDEAVRRGSYKVDVKVQVDKDGTMHVLDLVGSSGNTAIDTAIRNRKGCNIGQGRPVEVPALATVRVTSR